MVELVNAADSKSAGGNTLRVRVSLPAPEFRHRPLRQVLFFVPCIRRRGRFSAYRGPVFWQKQRRYLSFHVSESLSALQTEGAHGRARCTARGRKLPVPSFKAQSLFCMFRFFREMARNRHAPPCPGRDGSTFLLFHRRKGGNVCRSGMGRRTFHRFFFFVPCPEHHNPNKAG